MPGSLDRTFAALADPTRRQVVELLLAEPRRASELADALSMSRPAMSRHLKTLRDAGVVGESGVEEDARVRLYHLKQEPFSELSEWLAEVEAFWGQQLAAFKRHAEKGRR